MRKFIYASVAAVALVVTSVAIAHGIEGARSARTVAATFAATGSSAASRTCTTTDGKTIVVTDGRYTGTATGDADLTGPITLRARSVINTTDDVGTVTGAFKIAVAGRDTQATYSAVYDHGALAGLAVGNAHKPNNRLIGNLSAGFSAASGFTGGKLGGGTSGGSAVELAAGSCKASRTVAEKSEAHGTISALSTSSITVAGLTCAIPSDRAAGLNARFKTGDVAAIRCNLVSGQNTLTKIDGKGKHKH